MSSKEPTILIKKSDGSSERVSLEEFKNRKKKQDDLLVLPETHLATTTPVTEVFENEAEFSVDENYHKSLLEDDFSEIENLKKFNKNIPQTPIKKTEPLEIKKETKNDFDKFIRNSVNTKIKSSINLENKKVSDIAHPEPLLEKRTFGPVEEILKFSLEDFNRLSADPKKAVEMLLVKFENVKKESYFLYINFIRAWKKSPLYKLYLQVCLDSLREEKSVKNYLNENAKMNYDIFLSLVEVNKQIKM